ncbi:MAG: Bax inhibitor-1/YccA family protein [Victivallaceae bacterium]|nr:Bax inhibitor-1/YccA family protein [Victivallaceae bacterium]
MARNRQNEKKPGTSTAQTTQKKSLGAQPEASVVSERFINRVFFWMFAGLGVSGAVAWSVARSGGSFLRSNPNSAILLIVLTFGLVFVLSAAIHKISATAATLCFIAYAALNGAMLSTLLFVYSTGSVVRAFCATAVMFGATGIYGYVTRRDLSSLGSLLFMGLVGVIVASFVNFFLRSGALDWMLSFLGVVIFVGLTAFDMQKIKRFASGAASADGEVAEKAAILGALTLYLDFINLFLYLLRFFGNRK